MSINLNPLSSITTMAGALSNLILVSPKDVGYGPEDGSAPAFYFDYEGEQSTTLEAEITDHFIEDNTAVQDQIALHPKIYSTHGFVAELNNVVPRILGSNQNTAQDMLTLISAYTPALSVAALLAYNEAVQAYEIVQSAASTVNAWTGAPQTNQQKAYQKFAGYFASRTLFKIQTPWEVLDNMAIMSLRVVQDETTKQISDFQITFKQMQFVSATIGEADILASRAAVQSAASDPVGLGNVPGVSVPSFPIAGISL